MITVEPLHNGHLEERRKWPFKRGLMYGCMDRPPNKMVILERWPLVEVLLYVIFISSIYDC